MRRCCHLAGSSLREADLSARGTMILMSARRTMAIPTVTAMYAAFSIQPLRPNVDAVIPITRRSLTERRAATRGRTATPHGGARHRMSRYRSISHGVT